MSSKHALLGLLLDRPAYPYQLADRMQQRLGPSWKVLTPAPSTKRSSGSSATG